MTIEPSSGRAFLDRFARRQGLRWLGNFELLPKLIDPDFYEEGDFVDWSRLLDHVACFGRTERPKGEPEVVLAMSFVYADDSEALRDDVESFAKRFGLNCRVNYVLDRVYNAERYVPIAFWRDSHFTMI